MGGAGFWLAALVLTACCMVVSLVLGDPRVRSGPPQRGVDRVLRSRLLQPERKM